MASLAPRPSRTRNYNKLAPPELVLKDSTHNRQSQNLSSSNSSSSINCQPSQPSPHQHQYQHHHGAIQGQGQRKQSLFSNYDPQNGGGATSSGVTQFQSYNAQYPSYRPYTPTTPTAPSPMPITPTLGAFSTGSVHPTSPRLDRSPSFNAHVTSQGKASSANSGLLPYIKNQRSSSTRRIPSNESSLHDPYRSRQPSISANRVKNEYQAHSPIRENQPAYPPSVYNYYSRHGSSEELHEIHPYVHESAIASEEQLSIILPPPSIGQREEIFRQSPTLTASQTLAANYSTRPESPYLPYSSHHPLPSPSVADAYRSSAHFSSPGLGPYNTSHNYEDRSDRSDHKTDPYRSAYSQPQNIQLSSNSQFHNSPYQGSGSVSPNPNEDFSSSFESKFSITSSQPNSQQNNGSGNISNINPPRYPTRDLAGQESSQLLSAPFQDHGDHQQKRTTTVSSETAGPHSDKDTPSIAESTSGRTRQSTILPSQPSKTESSDSKKGKTLEEEEDEDNDMILQKIGALSANSSNGKTRSGITYSSGRSRRKGQWTDESEDDSQDRRGRNRRRVGHERSRRGRYDQGRCCCCTTRLCIIITASMLLTLAIALYFFVPRSPSFMFDSVSSTDPPVITSNSIQEPFSLRLLVDSTNNYMPIKLNSLNIEIYLTHEQVKIASNDNLPSAAIIQPRVSQILSIPMVLDFDADSTDRRSVEIYKQLNEACTPAEADSSSTVPLLNLTIQGELSVWGLDWIWKPTFKFDVGKIPCPANAKNHDSGEPAISLTHAAPTFTEDVATSPASVASSSSSSSKPSPVVAGFVALETQTLKSPLKATPTNAKKSSNP